MNEIDEDDLSLKFEMLIYNIIAKIESKPILMKIFERPSGEWVSFRKYIDEYSYNKEYRGLDVYICWLNEIEKITIKVD